MRRRDAAVRGRLDGAGPGLALLLGFEGAYILRWGIGPPVLTFVQL